MNKKDFLYGLSKMSFNGREVGYIEKDSFEWGGTAPESVDVEAEQVPDAPVLVLAQKNGTIAPKFNMIQLNYENLAAMLGGEVVMSSGVQTSLDNMAEMVATGWKAPKELVRLPLGVSMVHAPLSCTSSLGAFQPVATISAILSSEV